MPLYRVNIEKTIYVMADDEEAAEEWSMISTAEWFQADTKPDVCEAWEVSPDEPINSEWLHGEPYFDTDEIDGKTIEAIYGGRTIAHILGKVPECQALFEEQQRAEKEREEFEAHPKLEL